MALDPDILMRLEIPSRRVSYGSRDAILYAIAVGAASQERLHLAHEDGLRPLPSFGQNLAFDDGWMASAGVDLSKVVHAGLDLRFHAPFAPSGAVEIWSRIRGSRGQGRGQGRHAAPANRHHPGQSADIHLLLQSLCERRRRLRRARPIRSRRRTERRTPWPRRRPGRIRLYCSGRSATSTPCTRFPRPRGRRVSTANSSRRGDVRHRLPDCAARLRAGRSGADEALRCAVQRSASIRGRPLSSPSGRRLTESCSPPGRASATPGC